MKINKADDEKWLKIAFEMQTTNKREPLSLVVNNRALCNEI